MFIRLDTLNIPWIYFPFNYSATPILMISILDLLKLSSFLFIKITSEKNSTPGNVLVLHKANLDLFASILNGPLNTTRSDSWMQSQE